MRSAYCKGGIALPVRAFDAVVHQMRVLAQQGRQGVYISRVESVLQVRAIHIHIF